MTLELMKKLPLGGVDRRKLVDILATQGPGAAVTLLEKERTNIQRVAGEIAKGAVLILGGSNGITRSLVNQLVFGEGVPVFCVHYDSEKLQIGGHHANAIAQLAAKEKRFVRFINADALRQDTIDLVIDSLCKDFSRVHLINGIASGATKRFAHLGTTFVKDLDVEFDPVLQIPLFSNSSNYRKLGLVEVETASDAEVERTYRYMGHSTRIWVEALAQKNMIDSQSLIAFCDYEYETNDPVYGAGPLAQAKVIQRESLVALRKEYGARTTRFCYPPMATTALGAIPGGLLMYALSRVILQENGHYRDLPQLAELSMTAFSIEQQEFRLDSLYQDILPEFHRRELLLDTSDCPSAFRALWQ